MMQENNSNKLLGAVTLIFGAVFGVPALVILLSLLWGAVPRAIHWAAAGF